MSVAALIGAAGTLGALAIKNRMDKKRYERELQDQQKAWQRNNQYNSPAAQMSRLKAAGLSPNLVYQNGGATATSDTMGVPSYADAPMADFTPAAQMLQQSDLIGAQIEKMSAESAGINYDNIFKLSHSMHVSEETKQWLNGLALQNLETDTRIHSLEATTGLTRAETVNAMLNWSTTVATTKKLLSDVKVNEKTLEQIDSIIAKTNAETDLITKQYEMAIIDKALKSMQLSAEQKADKNTFELQIDSLEQTIEQLQFGNSEYMRRKQLVPSMNVPEQQKIYNDAFGSDITTGTAMTIIQELRESIEFWNQQRREAHTERQRQKAEKERQKAIDELNSFFEKQDKRIKRQQRVYDRNHN